MSDGASQSSATTDFPRGSSELATLIRSFDWSSTPLGPIERWPQSLKTATGIVIQSHVPMVMLWGQDGVMIYNDAYSVFAGGRHPQILGCKVREGWPEVADFNDNVMKVGLAGGTLAYKDQELTLHRHGAPEQVWMNLDYSPVIGEDGEPAGVIAIVAETTERVLADRRIAAERARREQWFSQMPGFVAILSGPDHVFDYVNDAYVTLAGPREFLGRTVRAVFPELDGQGFYELLDQVYATGERYVGRGIPVHLVGDADDRFVDLLYEPIRDDRGKVTGIFVGGYDVTETHRASEALRISEARLRELNADLERRVVERTLERGRTWQLSPELLVVINDAGYFETSNPAWAATLGWSEAELAAIPFIELVHPDDIANTQAVWADAIERGVPALRFENRYRHKNGEYRWLSWIGVPEDGKVYCSARDVTEEKAQAAALLQTRSDRDRMWRNSQDVITVLDMRGIVQSINPAVTKWLGWSVEDIVGKPVFDFIHPEDQPPVRDGMFLAERYAEPRVFPNRFKHKDGSYRSMAWLSALYDGYIYSSGRDVTLEEEQAAALKAAEEQLRQSQKMEAVGQLTGGIAHDFNNLLAGISGSLEMLQSRIAQGRLESVDRYVNAGQSGVRRAAALTHRLLAFSRRQTLDPKPTDINRLITGMEELVRRTMGPGVHVEVVGAGGLWSTLVDPNQLENALLNLCINARDAMPDGGRLTIETGNKWLDERSAAEQELPPGQYVSLCVTDTGTGMTPDVVSKAFDPFFTTKPLGEGTGLGLSMIYGFARQSGGQVRIYSEPGAGTTMCLYLPRHDQAAEAEGGAPVKAVPAPAGDGEVVLVIDDEPTIRMLITEVLQEAGYAAIEASDGPSGLRVLQSNQKIDLLITDVGLPGGLNGRQIADAARVERPDLKVLFITGYAQNAAIGAGHLDRGMQVVTKPFSMDVLARKIRDMIEG